MKIQEFKDLVAGIEYEGDEITNLEYAHYVMGEKRYAPLEELGHFCNCVERSIYVRIKNRTQFKFYDKVETWMLGKNIISKATGGKFEIEAICLHNRLLTSYSTSRYSLKEMFDRFTFEDGSPFGQEDE